MLPFLLLASQAAGIGTKLFATARQNKFDKQAQAAANRGFDLQNQAIRFNDIGFDIADIGFELNDKVFALEQQGAELDLKEMDLRMQQESLAVNEESLADSVRLGEVLSTQRAYLAARGTASGAGSALSASNKSINLANADERARRMSQDFRTLQYENQISLMKIRQYGQGVERENNRINQFGNQIGKANNLLGIAGNDVQRESFNIGVKSRISQRNTDFLLKTANMFSSNMATGGKGTGEKKATVSKSKPSWVRGRV